MKLETFFKEKDIDDIHNIILIYSILKYKELPKIWQEEFKERYTYAIQKLKERNINLNILENIKLEDLNERLTEYEMIYSTNVELNRDLVSRSGLEITREIVYTINKKQTEIDKITYLFDFITKYLTYSEDYNNYFLKPPPVERFKFEFKDNIPIEINNISIEKSINNTLVMQQGLCDDISNVLQYIGRILNLNISTMTCNYNGTLHCVNQITLSDGNNYLIDATRLIKKEKTKEECFLVSAEYLNKDNNYKFKEDISITKTYEKEIPNYLSESLELINNINNLLPQIDDLNHQNKLRTK